MIQIKRQSFQSMASWGEKDRKKKISSGNLMINGKWDMEMIFKYYKTKEKHKTEKFTTSPTNKTKLTNEAHESTNK